MKMNVFSILGTFFDLASGIIVSKFLEDDMRKTIAIEIDRVTADTNSSTE